MKKRMHLKRKKKNFKKTFIIIIILIILSLLLKKYVSVKPLIIAYSEMEANKLATVIINAAILKENTEEKINDIYKINDTAITNISYDTKELNKILANITLKIQNYFGAIESGNIDDIGIDILDKYNYNNLKKGPIIYIPMGYLTGSPFLANVGPKVPLKITLIGDVQTDIKTEVKDYGLNNALLKIYIRVEVVTQSIFPLVSSIQTTIVEYPVVLKIIEGKVPSFYLPNT